MKIICKDNVSLWILYYLKILKKWERKSERKLSTDLLKINQDARI